jgi:arylsulfatase A-like enzyme
MIGKAVAERVKALGMAGGAIPCLGDNPNVIFILADDQGWGDAGYNGHPSARTPNLDRLAADGTVIKNFYVNGTVCSPSRAAFLTGMYPARLGFHHITSKPDVNKQRQVPD